MGQKNNVIQINNKSYDAITGAVIPPEQLAGKSAWRPAPAKTVDGFFSQPTKPISGAKKPVITAKPALKSATLLERRSGPISDFAQPRPAAKHLNPHKPANARTLMRSGVTKPNASLKRTAKLATSTDLLAPAKTAAIRPKLSSASVEPKRVNRAHTVAQHGLVSRFGHIKPPVNRADSHHPAIRRPAAKTQPKPATRRSVDIFEAALEEATSHKQEFHVTSRRKGLLKNKRKLLNSAAAVVAVLLIGGFVVYQNQSNVRIKLASSKAGFSASLPSWHPPDFAASKFKHSPGHVKVAFRDNSGQRKFHLAEQPSKLDSTSLLNEVVAKRSTSYQTYQSAGQTVYIYGDNDAVWVSGGVRYELTSNGNLNTEQLLHLASTI